MAVLLWMELAVFHEILTYMDPTTVNPNANFMTGTDPNLVNSLYAPGATQTTTTGQTPTPTTTTSTVPPTTPQTPSTPAAPSTNLEPGAQGQDVEALQSYLVQMGYLNPSQIGSGSGTYGPQTTAAVAKLQNDLGINAGTAAGDYGPQTQTALNQKYQGVFQSVQNKQTPNTASEANTQIQAASQPSTDPVFGALTSSLAPIMDSLNQVLSNINNPALTAVSLQQEYNTLAAQSNLPALNSQLLNMQNIMNGTTDDIRNEISSAGGTATESQVQAMSSARNTVILKQYNALSSQYTAAQQNIQTQLQYATTDQQTELSRQQATAGVEESMASIESQALSMGMTMQQNAVSAIQYNVSQTGYKGLADSAQGNPQVLSYYESMLGLAPGALSNPNTLSQLDTYKDQTLQLNNYKAAIAAYNAGYYVSPPNGNPTTTTGNPTNPVGQIGVTPVDPSTLIRPSYLNTAATQNIPLSLSASKMEQYMTANKAASVDPGTNNIVAPGIGYYVQQSDGSYVLNSALPSTVQQQYNSIQQTINSAGNFSGSPKVTGQWTRAANSVISNFTDTGTYKVVSNVAPYLAAIQAASVNPGDKSVSDFELLDSFVKAAKGGTGQVTDSQVNVMLSGASLGDNYSTLEQKLNTGGVLAPAQRTALISLAQSTFNDNIADYTQQYVQATQAMQAQGIPAPFWRNLPTPATFGITQ